MVAPALSQLESSINELLRKRPNISCLRRSLLCPLVYLQNEKRNIWYLLVLADEWKK